MCSLKLDSANFWAYHQPSSIHSAGRSSAHFDPLDNLLVQLKGRKVVYLVSPVNSAWMHPRQKVHAYHPTPPGQKPEIKLHEDEPDHFSAINLAHPNISDYPELRQASPTVCTIEEGEMLFIPAYTWHDVFSYTDQESNMNLAVNYWFQLNPTVGMYHNIVHRLLTRSNEILDRPEIDTKVKSKMDLSAWIEFEP